MNTRVVIGGFLEAATNEQHFTDLVTDKFGADVQMFVMFRDGQRGALLWIPSTMELISAEALKTVAVV